MDNAITIALIGAAGGLVSGTLVSLIAPWVNWGIEKRKQKLAYQRELVASWRKMIEEAVRLYKTEGKTENVMDFVERHGSFYSLRPHLSKQTIGELHRPRTMIGGSTVPAAITHMAREIAELEKKWKLL